jgi:hypothetical protein
MFEKFFTVNLNSQLYFSGEAVPGNEKENVPFNLALDVIRFFIWQCKLNKKKANTVIYSRRSKIQYQCNKKNK